MIKEENGNIFDKIHHSVNVFHSLQNCRDTFVMNREGIDERLFEELNNFESFMKKFETTFLQILMDDLQAISNAAVINTDNSEKAEELIENIDTLIGNFSRMESDSIARSESLIKLASKFKSDLSAIKMSMESKVKAKKKNKKALSSAVMGLAHAN